MTSHDNLREAVKRHGLSANELISSVQANGAPLINATMLVQRFLAGGTTAVIVAEAVIELIVQSQRETRH